MKAFIFDPLWDKLTTPELHQKLASAGIELIVTQDIAPLSECAALFEGAEERVLCLNPDYVGWKLTNTDYKDIPNLKAILIASTSFGWVENDIAKDRDIPICNIKNFSTQAVAEWAVTMMLNLERQIPRLIKNDFPLDMDADFLKYRGAQIKGKVAGIIGLGHNGLAIAERCAGLGMEVVYWSRASTNDRYKRVELAELMANADVIFPAFAKNSETASLVTDEMLITVKPSAVVVDIIDAFPDKTLILDMVKRGDMFGFGFEAAPATFSKYEGNVWAAPAYAWVTYESMYNSEVKLIDNIIDAAKSSFSNRVN